MKPFVQSQIDAFPSYRTGIRSPTSSSTFIAIIEGKRNHPVNLSAVFSFRADSQADSVYGGLGHSADITYHCILFTDYENTTLARWWYPPTDQGKAQRDNDLVYLNNNFVAKCSGVNPTIPPRIK